MAFDVIYSSVPSEILRRLFISSQEKANQSLVASCRLQWWQEKFAAVRTSLSPNPPTQPMLPRSRKNANTKTKYLSKHLNFKNDRTKLCMTPYVTKTMCEDHSSWCAQDALILI